MLCYRPCYRPYSYVIVHRSYSLYSIVYTVSAKSIARAEKKDAIHIFFFAAALNVIFTRFLHSTLYKTADWEGGAVQHPKKPPIIFDIFWLNLFKKFILENIFLVLR